jgi:hypothetical protein
MANQVIVFAQTLEGFRAAVLPLLHNEALPQHATVRCHSEVEHITGRQSGRR